MRRMGLFANNSVVPNAVLFGVGCFFIYRVLNIMSDYNQVQNGQISNEEYLSNIAERRASGNIILGGVIALGLAVVLLARGMNAEVHDHAPPRLN